MIKTAKIIVISLLLSSTAWADRDEWRGDHEYRRHDRDYGEGYYQPRRMEYVPVQPVYAAPPPPPRYYGYAPPPLQGLLGGAAGSVLGYQMSNGNPLGAGIGAAAGAFIGNGMR